MEIKSLRNWLPDKGIYAQYRGGFHKNSSDIHKDTHIQDK